MKYYWRESKYKHMPDIRFLSCFFTDTRGHRRNVITLVELKYIDEFKIKFEQLNSAIENGAWRDKDHALWTIWPDGKCTISEDQIELVA